jgi:hypothetical protein
MVAVRPAANDMQGKVDLGRREFRFGCAVNECLRQRVSQSFHGPGGTLTSPE